MEAQQAASHDNRLDAARRMIGANDFKGAEPVLREYVKSDQKSSEAAFLLGYVLLRLNKPKESLVEYTRGAALKTPSAEDLKHVAQDYVLLNDYEDADTWMVSSVKMDGKNADSWYALGRIRFTEQKFQDAADFFEKSLALSPRTVKTEDNLGLAYQNLNRMDDAIKAFQRALEWQKDSAHPSEQPMLNLGIVYIEAGKLDDALPLLLKAVEIAPKDPRIREQLGVLYMGKNQLGDAQREFEAAVALAPENAAYHFLLGRVYHREGQDAKAHAEFDRAASLNGTHATPNSY
jgi:tetratricopeptide (TPR) repeat protein